MKKHAVLAMLLTALVLSGYLFWQPGAAETFAGQTAAADLISGAPQTVPVPGKVTMVDLGAHKCIPCRMMSPIIKELSVEYDGKAAIVFIDVWEHPDIPKQYGIRTIPTQIFYDAEGKERFRHEGFLNKESIVAKLQELGAS